MGGKYHSHTFFQSLQTSASRPPPNTLNVQSVREPHAGRTQRRFSDMVRLGSRRPGICTHSGFLTCDHRCVCFAKMESDFFALNSCAGFLKADINLKDDQKWESTFQSS